MTGGLINIASYVANDLYLTGAPQITFYKMVYRRYTNFAMESVVVNFDDALKFNHESELLFPRTGDLIHKLFLHIRIPSISITKEDVGIDISDFKYNYADKSTVSDYEKIKNVYMKIFTDIYRIIYKAVNASNVTYLGLFQDVQDYVNTNDILKTLDDYNTLLTTKQKELILNNDKRSDILDYTRSNLWYILSNIDVSKLYASSKEQIDTENIPENSDEYSKELQRIMKNTALKEIEKGLDFCVQVQQYFFDEYLSFIKQSERDRSNNVKAAWVRNLGHSIIDYVDIFIGGKRIDRHLGIWINIWYQLTYKESQRKIYNKLIGNVSELTDFNSLEKPQYDIYIPMTFWFNKFNGLSFPLIAMQYNDLRLNVKLRNLEQVFFIEKIYKADLNGNQTILTAEMIDFIQNKSEDRSDLTLSNIEEVKDINILDIFESKGKALFGDMLVDYVYLDSLERKRFAQSGHEYLIERIQYDEFTGIDKSIYDVQLNFTTPSKELIWVMHKDIYKERYCDWSDYSLSKTHNNKNPILDAQISFNNYVRVQKQEGKYFDTYQPYVFHRASPSAGINLYSFSLDPMQNQPTGTCNFTKLSNVRMLMNLDLRLFNYTDTDIYPYDLDINFTLAITDYEIIDKINTDYAEKVIRTYKTDGEINDKADTVEIINEIASAEITLDFYNKLLIGQSRGEATNVSLDDYRKVIFKTNSTFFVFDLTLNILRLIGGYGELAYSGNT